MPLHVTDKRHNVHRAMAAEQGREFRRIHEGLSVSTVTKDAAWSSVIELSCIVADGKSSICVNYGVRNEPTERALSSTSASPTFSKFVSLDPMIDEGKLLQRLSEFARDSDEMLVELNSVEDLIGRVERQGGTTLVF